MEGTTVGSPGPTPGPVEARVRPLSAAEAYRWLIHVDLNPSRLKITIPGAGRKVTLAPEWEKAALAAEQRWGLAGVGLESVGDLLGAALLCSDNAIPSGHALARGGLSPDTAGLSLVVLADTHHKDFVVALLKALKGQAHGIEAQSARFWEPTTPSATWLSRMGFTQLPYPRGRYRLDLNRIVTVEPVYERPLLFGLLPRPAQAARTASP